MTKKRKHWKYWIKRILLLIFIVFGVWLVNLIWFKPFSIDNFYERIFVEIVMESPELTTQIGVPFLYDMTKDDLDDISDSAQRESLENLIDNYHTLLSYDFESQSEENQLNTKILASYLKTLSVEREPFLYHDYPVNQMEGVYKTLPNLLVNFHRLEDQSDIEAYISRLSKFDVKFNQLIENLNIRKHQGIALPKFINTIVLSELKGFIGLEQEDTTESSALQDRVKENVLYTNFEAKVSTLKDITSEEKEHYKQQVFNVLKSSIFPAYGKLISYIEEQNKTATNDAGVWKLPDGDAYYRYKLKEHTTTDLSPEEVHHLGLSEVARIKKEMLAILESQGLADSTKTLGEIVQSLNKDQRFLYPNNDEGRKLAIEDYRRILFEVDQGIDHVFDIRPRAGLDVKRVPEFKQEGSPFAYYEGPPMDGSSGGVFFTNLRDMNDVVKFGMKTIAYHEGIPGHHFQVAIQRELKGLPTFRTVVPFTAYIEGWALYSERLAWELGFYDNDPFGNLGRLQAEMWRSVRLVVDSGIHFKKWTREEAITYMYENTGIAMSDVVTEIERYVVLPGQACSYKVGMIKLLELREKARQALGDKFKLSDFHNVVLKNGAVPLSILEELVNDYIAQTN